jgi:thiol-disulfide isomerase/thioredoxin
MRPAAFRPGPTRRLALFGVCAALLANAGPASAVTAPRLPPVQFSGPPPQPYDASAKAEADIAAAAKRARAAGKLLLIDMGGNWCTDCLVLAIIMDQPVAKAFIAKHYETVTVDVGHFDKNLQIPARYGVTLKEVPCIVVIDAKGKVVNKGQELKLGSAASMQPQAVLDLLASWASAGR